MDLPDGGYRPPPIHVCQDETYPSTSGAPARMMTGSLCFGLTHVMVASTLTNTIGTETVRPVPSKKY